MVYKETEWCSIGPFWNTRLALIGRCTVLAQSGAAGVPSCLLRSLRGEAQLCDRRAMRTYRYRPEVLEELLEHGVRPTERTRPELVHEFVSDLYRFELRRLRDP